MKEKNKYFIYDTVIKYDWKYPLKLIRRFFRIFTYSINFFISKKKFYEKKYFVSICAIFKNESQYLQEWIEFNKLIGIQHFYLYNNNSNDNYYEVLKPYIESGIVTLLNWSKNQAQMECYRDCIQKFKNDSNWIGFIDIDEFIVPNSIDNVQSFLMTKIKQPSVLIYWKMFGSSGLKNRDLTGLVCEDFILSEEKYSNIGKCFYNTCFDFYDDIYNTNSCLHHWFYAKSFLGKLAPMNCFGKICCEPTHNPVKMKKNDIKFPIQINHYFTKSFDEYLMKASKGDVYFLQNPHNLDYFYKNEMGCTFQDYSAYKYLCKLKLILKR